MMNMKLPARNSKIYKALSVVLAIMVVVLSLPYSTSATVSQDLKDTVLSREQATTYDKDEFVRIYIGAEDYLGWDGFEVHAVSKAERDYLAGTSTDAIEDVSTPSDASSDTDAKTEAASSASATMPASGTDPKDVGTKLELNMVYRTDTQEETQLRMDCKKLEGTSDIDDNYVSVYYVDVPRSAAGIFACIPGDNAYESTMLTELITTELTDGEFYYVTQEIEDIDEETATSKYILKKASQPSLSGFTVSPPTRTTFCRGDNIPFALNRSSVVSPVGNDFVYRFYYYKQGDTQAIELKQEPSDTEPYWISQEDAIGVGSETLVTNENMEIGSYFVYMTITDGYTTYKSEEVSIKLDPVGALTIEADNSDIDKPVYDKNGVIYYGSNGVKVNVHASEIAQVAYMATPTDADLASQTMWENKVDIDEDGLGSFYVSKTDEEKQHSSVLVAVRGYNKDGDIIKDGVQLELVCDQLAPSATATISSGDADVWKQEKTLQFVIKDTGETDDDLGSGIAQSTDKLYLVNTTTGREIKIPSELIATNDDRNVTVQYVVYESGTYVLHYCDYLGNEGETTIAVEKVDRVSSEITVTERTSSEWVNVYKVEFDVNKNVAASEGSLVDGKSDIIEAYYADLTDGKTFENATKHSLTAASQSGDVEHYTFDVTKAGKYVIYVRDTAGNEATKEIDLDYIDDDAPSGKVVISSDQKSTNDMGSDDKIIFQDPSVEEIIIKAEKVMDVGESGIASVEYFIDYNYATNKLLTTSENVRNILGKDGVYDGITNLPTKGKVTLSENPDKFQSVTSESGEQTYTVELASISEKQSRQFVVYIIIKDNAGNETLAYSNVVIIDSTEPKIEASLVYKTDEGYNTLPSGWYNGDKGDVFVRIDKVEDNENGSGIAVKDNGVPDITYILKYKSTSDETNETSVFARLEEYADMVSSNKLVNGEYDVIVRVRDVAGNIGECEIKNVQIDNVTPTVTITSDTLGTHENDFSTVNPPGEITVKIETGCSGYSSGILQYKDNNVDKFVNANISPTNTETDADGNLILTYTIAENKVYSFVATSTAGLTGTAEYEIDNIETAIGALDVSIKYPDTSTTYNSEWTDKNLKIYLARDSLSNEKSKDGNYKYNYEWQYAVADTIDDLNKIGDISKAWNTLANPAPRPDGTGRSVTFNYNFNLFDIIGTTNANLNKYYKFRIVKSYTSRKGTNYDYYPSTPYLIRIDNVKPEVNKPVYTKTLADQILETLTFGLFSTDDINVTLKATDTGSGVKKFHYTLYGEGSVKEEKTVTEGIKNEGNGVSSYTFTIKKDYIGKLDFSAEDALGHRSDDASAVSMDQLILIDSVKPGKPVLDVKTGATTVTSGELVNNDITVTVATSTDPTSGVEGFYIGETNDPSEAKKLDATVDTNTYAVSNVVEGTDKKSFTLSDNSQLTLDTVTTVTFNVNVDVNKKYYFFTKTNAGLYSDPQEFSFNLDKTKPEITKFEFDGNAAETIESSDYGLYFNNDTNVKIYATDNFDTVTTRPTGSGLDSITVWLINSDNTKNESFGEKKITVEDGKNYVEVTIPADFKGNIYAYATDKATNQSDTKHPYGTIVESNAQHQKEEHITFTAGGDDKYSNKDVDLTVNVIDTYSGIKNLEWHITVDGKEEAAGNATTDVNGNVTTNNTKGNSYKSENWAKDVSDINLVTKVSRTFKLNFDSNNVIVTVTMTDNAGNTTKKEYSVNIDKTAPVVMVSYDNNNVKNDKYFNADRTLKLEIQELNFDDTCASKISVKLKKDGEYVSLPAGFTMNSETGRYTLTYAMSEGVYELESVTCTDLAGNTTDTSVNKENMKVADGTKAATSFVIDKTKPVVTVAFDNQSSINEYFKADRTVTVTVNDFALQSSGVDITATIGGSDISIDKSKFTIADATAITTIGECVWTNTFGNDGEYTFNINEIVDKAGNKAEISYGSNAYPNSFIIDKTKPVIKVKYTDHAALQTPYYFKDYREAQITVTERNFDPEKISANITAIDLSGAEVSEAYITALKEQLSKLSNWTINGSVYTQTIKLGIDDSTGKLVNAIYHFDLVVTDKAGNSNEGIEYNSSNAQDSTGTKNVNTDFVIDGEGPENLQIEVKDSTISKILNVITGGIFFKETVDVILTAEDKLSGVSKFVYTLNYDNVENSSLTGNGRVTKTIDESGITYDGNKATATFKIEPQFRGYISFYAVDRADSQSNTYDPNDKQVVVDSIAPVVAVTFDNNDGKLCADDNKTYYKNNRTATIKITETNFFAEDITIKVNGTRITPNFAKDESGRTPVYTAEYKFTKDGEYELTVEYNDRSGNAANINATNSNKFEEKFVIDTVRPQITISYDNNTGTNGYYGPRTATITMNETNFVNTKDVKFSIIASDVSGSITAPTPTAWTTPVGGLSTAQIVYGADGNYEFDISYADPAGNVAEVVFADGTMDGDLFTVDTEAPYDATISYNNSAFRSFINIITGGLVFDDTVTVKVRVNDKTSGISKIEYICDVADGVSKVNSPTSGTLSGKNITKLDASSDSSLKYTYEAEFKIDPNYRGKVKVLVYDAAGNMTNVSDTTDANELIVDNKSPQWGKFSYAYSGSNTKNGVTKYYFNKQITGTFVINEANFDKKTSLNVKITKDGVAYDSSKFSYSWTAPSGNKSDDWKASFTLGNSKLTEADNGEYIITINYTDVAGNKINEYVSTPLVIDTVKPKFEVSYDNNDVKNDKYFPNIRTATLVITEPNIKSEDITVKLTATNPNQSVKAPVISEWKTVGNKHTATVTFDANAEYKLDIKCKDLATNSIDLGNVEFGASKAGTDFVVDRVAPTGSITVGDWSASVNGTVWDKIISTITFGLFSRDDLSVTIKSSDNLSGVNKVQYFVSSTKLSNNELKSKTDWQTGKAGTYTFTMSNNNQFIVYAKITDRADNVKYLSTDGIIIDQLSPKINGVEPKTEISLNEASDQPETTADGDMLFNGNIVLDVKVTDVAAQVNGVDVYSGLQSVTYQVISNGVETQSGTLNGAVDKEISQTTGLVYSQSDTITIDADRNNTNDIRLVVTAIDNVGNKTVNEQKFMIDTTAPEISVSYDNDSPDTMGAYFKDARTATITITERNFNPNKVSLTITSTDGTVPKISEWTTIEGSTPDDTRHRATLVYSADGDYTFDMSYTDEAGNKAGNVNYGASISPREFTIDRTVPVIAVSYDNNSSTNGNYFNASRTATIMIVEHNFETSRIVVSGTASDDGIGKTFPSISSWSTSGDNHYATITFTDDAEYKFSVSYKDKAGNAAKEIPEQNFYIDNINPVITIDGVENNTAYGNGSEVAPVLTFTDKNFDSSKIKITLKGSKRGDVDVKGTFSDVVHGKMFTFDNIEAIPDNDDIYTLTATVEDLSGRSYVLPAVKFSINRFGSTYEVSEEVKTMTGLYYVQRVEDDVVIIEYNVDDIEDYTIEISVNGNTATALKEGEDFKVTKEHDDGNWAKFTYTIDKSIFDEEGSYAIVLKSKDAAENSSYSDLANTDLKFIVDRTVPTVVLSGITSGGRYRVEAQTVKLLVTDDNRLGNLKVIINGTEEKTWTVEELEELNGEITFTLQNSNDAQSVEVICTDAAGNEKTIEITDVIISTSSFVQIYNNRVIFYGAIAILAGVLIIAFIIILIKRRNKDDEEEITVEDYINNNKG